MNSDTDKQLVDFETGTEKPAAIFTISIGGNIVSRGVTFNNLLTMFFTREVKHKIQQDTYIQRARMFGNRGEYIENFELSIPEDLYDNWHRCFQFHRIAYAHAISGKPAWLGDKKVRTYLTHGAPSIPVLTLYLNSVKLRLVMGVYSFVFGWFKTKTRQFWSVPFVDLKKRIKYLRRVEKDVLSDIKK